MEDSKALEKLRKNPEFNWDTGELTKRRERAEKKLTKRLSKNFEIELQFELDDIYLSRKGKAVFFYALNTDEPTGLYAQVFYRSSGSEPEVRYLVDDLGYHSRCSVKEARSLLEEQ